MDNSPALRTFISIGVWFEIAVIAAALFALVLSPVGTESEETVVAEPPTPVTLVYVPGSIRQITLTPTPTPTPTYTPTPTPTHTPTPTTTPTETPIPPTLTPVPRLTPGPTWPLEPVDRPESAWAPILIYHYVEELPGDADEIRVGLTVPPAVFEAHLKYLSDNGYHTITLDDLYRYLVEARPLPDKPIILTFDDGYRDHYEVVFPLLQKYHFVGTFFVLTGTADNQHPQYMTWAMMLEMSRAGMDIEAHGVDHVSMGGRPYEFLYNEMLGAKLAIEGNVGQEVHFFCYPYGVYDAGAIQVLKSLGYWGAVTTWSGTYQSLGNLFGLYRIRIGPDDTPETLAVKMGEQ